MIKRLTIVMILLLTVVSLAKAEMKTYQRSALWENAAGINDQNERMCTLAHPLKIQTANEWRWIGIKYQEKLGPFMHIVKSSWNIPKDTDVSGEVGFDGGFWGNVIDAYGEKTKILVNINEKGFNDFIEQLRTSKIMNIKFGGNEGQWNVDLTGTRETIPTFLKCVALLKVGSTQPFTSEKKAPSQPFSSDDNIERQPVVRPTGKEKDA